MSLWKKISLGVVIVILLLLGSVAFLVGTTSGLHLVFKAADRWVPGLDIGKVTGGAGVISPCLTFVMSSQA
ncbi:hypothetical protein VEE57_17680 [Escherichia coli]|nr:hypothetical protein VEE57_17680 [Escherichia coli]